MTTNPRIVPSSARRAINRCFRWIRTQVIIMILIKGANRINDDVIAYRTFILSLVYKTSASTLAL